MPEININNTEDALKAWLDLKLATEIAAGDIEVELLPDQPNSFKRVVAKKRRVSICYTDTMPDTDKLLSTDRISQEVWNNFSLFMACKTRKGEQGLNDLYDKLLKWVIGLALPGHTRFRFKKNELYMRDDNAGLFLMRLEVSARTRMLEGDHDFGVEYPKLIRIDFNPEPGYAGENITVDENTVIGDNPIFPPKD